MDWSDLTDTPENRLVYLKSRHILDWPIDCMEAMRLSAVGYSRREIATRLQQEDLEVEVWLDYAAGRICVTWPELRPEEPVVATWLQLHERCCVHEWQVEVDEEGGRDQLPEGMNSPEERRRLPRWRRWRDHDLDEDKPILPPPHSGLRTRAGGGATENRRRGPVEASFALPAANWAAKPREDGSS